MGMDPDVISFDDLPDDNALPKAAAPQGAPDVIGFDDLPDEMTAQAPVVAPQASGMMVGIGSGLVRGFQNTSAGFNLAEKFKLIEYKNSLEKGGAIEESDEAQIERMMRPEQDARAAEIARVNARLAKLDEQIKESTATAANYPGKSMPYQALQQGIEQARKSTTPFSDFVVSARDNIAGVPELLAEGAYATGRPIAAAIASGLALRKGQARPIIQTLGPIAASMGVTGIDSYRSTVTDTIEQKAREGGIDLRKNPEILGTLLTDADFIEAVKSDALKAGVNDAAWAGISTALGMSPRIRGIWQPVTQAGAEVLTDLSNKVVRGKEIDTVDLGVAGVTGAAFEAPGYAIGRAIGAFGSPAAPATPGAPAAPQATPTPAAPTPTAAAPDVIPFESLPSVAGETVDPAAAEPAPAPASLVQPEAAAVPPAPVRPDPNTTTAADMWKWVDENRAWQEKYGKTHNADGTPKGAAAPTPAPAQPQAEAPAPAAPAPTTQPQATGPDNSDAAYNARAAAWAERNRQRQEAAAQAQAAATPAPAPVEPRPKTPDVDAPQAEWDAYWPASKEWDAKHRKTHWNDGAPKRAEWVEGTPEYAAREAQAREVEARRAAEQQAQAATPPVEPTAQPAAPAPVAVEPEATPAPAPQPAATAQPAAPAQTEIAGTEDTFNLTGEQVAAPTTRAEDTTAEMPLEGAQESAIATEARARLAKLEAAGKGDSDQAKALRRTIERETQPAAPAAQAEAPTAEPQTTKEKKPLPEPSTEMGKKEYQRLMASDTLETSTIGGKNPSISSLDLATAKELLTKRLKQLAPWINVPQSLDYAIYLADVRRLKAHVDKLTAAEQSAPAAQAEAPAPTAEQPNVDLAQDKDVSAETKAALAKANADVMAAFKKYGKKSQQYKDAQKAKKKIFEKALAEKSKALEAERDGEPAPIPSTPEREAKINAILDNAEAADQSYTYEIKPIYQLKGSDGKWYRPQGFPFGIKNTGEKRIEGYAAHNRDGISYGKVFATEAEAQAFQEDGRKARREEFRKSLEQSDDARLNDQAKFWEGERATFDRRNPEAAARRKKPAQPNVRTDAENTAPQSPQAEPAVGQQPPEMAPPRKKIEPAPEFRMPKMPAADKLLIDQASKDPSKREAARAAMDRWKKRVEEAQKKHDAERAAWMKRNGLDNESAAARQAENAALRAEVEAGASQANTPEAKPATAAPAEQTKRKDPKYIARARSNLAMLEEQGKSGVPLAKYYRDQLSKWEGSSQAERNSMLIKDADETLKETAKDQKKIKRGDYDYGVFTPSEAEAIINETPNEVIKQLIDDGVSIADIKALVSKPEYKGLNIDQSLLVNPDAPVAEAAPAEQPKAPEPVAEQPKKEAKPRERKPDPKTGEPYEVTLARRRVDNPKTNPARYSQAVRILDQYENDQKLAKYDETVDLDKVSDEALGDFLDAHGQRTDATTEQDDYFKGVEKYAERRFGSESSQYGDLLADIRNLAKKGRALPVLPKWFKWEDGRIFSDIIKSKVPFALASPPLFKADEKRAKTDPEYRKDIKDQFYGMVEDYAEALKDLGWTQTDPSKVSSWDAVVDLVSRAADGERLAPEGGVLGVPAKSGNPRMYSTETASADPDFVRELEEDADTREPEPSDEDKQAALDMEVEYEDPRFDAEPTPADQAVLDAAADNAPTEQSILDALDKAAAERLDPRNRSSIGPDLIAALAWQTARDIQRGLTNFAKWAAEKAKQFPGLKGSLKAIWARAQDIAKRPMDYIRFRALDSIADKVWQNAGRNPASATLRKIANIVFAKSGPDADATENDIPTRINLVRNQFSNIYAGIMERFAREFADMTPEQRRKWDADFRAAVIDGTTPSDTKVAQAVKDFRKLMRDMLDYQRNAGIEMGDQGANYFPRNYDADAVEADRDGFVAAAQEMYRKREERLLQKAIRDVRRAEKDRPAERRAADRKFGRKEKTDAEYRQEAAEWAQEKIDALEAEFDAKDDDYYKQKAEDWATAITHGDVLGMTLFKTNEGKVTSDSTDARTFTNDEAKLADAFLKKNIDDIMLGYIDGAVRGAEVGRVFGQDGSKFEQMMNKLSAEGVDKETVKETRRLVQKALGVGREQQSQATAAFFDWVNVVLAGAFLGKTFMYNLVLEPISFGIRTGNAYLALKAMADTWRYTIAEISKPSAATRQRVEAKYGSQVAFAKAVTETVAEQVGLIQNEMERAYFNSHWDYSSDEKGSKMAKWISQRIYRANLMSATERAKVRASIGIARLALRDNARFFTGDAPIQKLFKALGFDVNADKSAAMVLRENGVPDADHKAFAAWVAGLEGKTDAEWQKAVMDPKDPMAKHYRRALQRMSLGMSIKTNPALKMEMSDSVLGRLMMQLMNYSYAYSNLVKDRMYSMAAQTVAKDASTIDRLRYAAPLMVGAPLAILGAAASKALIAGIWPSDDEEKRSKETPMVRKAFNWASFAGMFGPKVEYLFKSFERGQAPGGPVGETIFRGGQAAFAAAGDPDSEKKAFNARKQLYNSTVKPVVTGAGAAVHPFFGFLGNAAVNTQVVRESVTGGQPRK